MQLAEKIALALVGGLVVVVGGVVVVKAAKPATTTTKAATLTPASTTPTRTLTAATSVWVSTTQINPGDNVRITVAPADLQTIATSLGLSTTGQTAMAIWTSVLANPTVQAALNAQNIQAWAPGQTLPSDWPSGDAHASDGYHAQFTYQGSSALALSTSPVPMTAWVQKGLGAS